MTVRFSLAVFLLSVLCGCAGNYGGGYQSYGSGSSEASTTSSSSSVSESSSESQPPERSYVDHNGNMVFRKPGETTVVSPDGGVKIIQRDSDGTRTVVDSDGNVRVEPPGHHHSRH